VALPFLKSLVSPRTFDIQKTFDVMARLSLFKILSRDPKQGMGRAAVGHLQWFEIERLRFGPLSQQFPVVSAFIENAGRAFIAVTRQLKIIDQPAECFVSQQQPRLNFRKLGFGECRPPRALWATFLDRLV
jgi:hypothetical protein